MPTPYDDPTRAFERELRRAERERRRLVALAGIAGVAIVGLVIIVAAVASVRTAAAAKSEAPKRIELAKEAASPEPEPTAEKIATSKKPSAQEESEPAATAKAPVTAPKPTPAPTRDAAPKPASKPAVQRLSVGLGQYGYSPETLTAKAGIPIKLTVAKGEGCAAGFLIPSLNISADNSTGPATVSLPALDAGSYQFMCAMQMVSGTLIVKAH